jgi:DNA-binding NtrC family response regulator
VVNFTAAEAKGALARIEEGGGVVIIADYSLPDLDGLTLLEKAAELEPDMPRIQMTAFPDVNITIEAINHAHVTNFFPKLFKPQEVSETV